jgi:hypothetical protein
VPVGVQGVQAWDRYAYVNNNPARFNDPSGHCIDPDNCPWRKDPLTTDQASSVQPVCDTIGKGRNWGSIITLPTLAGIGGDMGLLNQVLRDHLLERKRSLFLKLTDHHRNFINDKNR